MRRLLWLMIMARAVEGGWTTALRLPNGTSFYALGAPLFRSDNPQPTAIFGADGVTDLAIPANFIDFVWATTPTCVVRIQGNMVHAVVVGNLLEAGRRNGPPRFARFTSLTALAVVRLYDSTSPNWNIALIDAAAPDNNIFLANPWTVRPLALCPQAFALSMLPKTLLVISPATAFLLMPAASMPITKTTTIASGEWTAGLLFSPQQAYLTDSAKQVWLWLPTTAELLLLQAATNSVYSKLFWALDGVWGASFTGQMFALVALPATMPDITAFVLASNVTGSYYPFMLYDAFPICPIGYVHYGDLCVRSPPGGYAVDGIFYPCPSGTHNGLIMATSSACCQSCPGFTIAPYADNNAVCAACNQTHPLQSPDGRTCLSECPPSTSNNSSGGKCRLACAPGFSLQAGSCAACPAMTFMNAADGRCTPCPNGQASTDAATSCSTSASYCANATATTTVFTVASNLPRGIVAFVAAANGTLFFATPSSLQIRPPTAATKSLALSIIACMALDRDEKALYYASGASIWRLVQQASSTLYFSHDTTISALSSSTAGTLFVLDTGNSVWRIDSHTATLVFRPQAQVLHITTTTAACYALLLYLDDDNYHHDDAVNSPYAGSPSALRVVNIITGALVTAIPLRSLGGIYQPWFHLTASGGIRMFVGHALVAIVPEEATVILAGDMHTAGHRDDEAPLALFYTPAYSIIMDGDGAALLLLEPDTATLRLVYTPPACQCPAGFFMPNATLGVCLPCPTPTTSMANAQGPSCTTCPLGQYRDGYGACQECPYAFWWKDPLIASVCTPMQDTTLSAGAALTFRQAIGLAAAGGGGDIMSTATVLIADYQRPPPHFVLPDSDYLGRLWFAAPALAPACTPGLWVLCAPPAQPNLPCQCWYDAQITLDYYDIVMSPWGNARRRAAAAANYTLFAHRATSNPNNNNVFVPLQNNDSTNANESMIELASTGDSGDTGMCYIGWPAQCNCTDPIFYWSLERGACLACAAGTFAPEPTDVACIPISAEHMLCNEGTYILGQRCFPCPAGTFSDTKMATACTPKAILGCAPGYYLHSTPGASTDNDCRPCVPCAAGTIMIPSALSVAACPGDTTHPGYTCVVWAQNIAGFSVVVTSWSEDNEPSLGFIPCPTPAPANSQWVTGPNFAFCYFSCLYGVDAPTLQEYAYHFVGDASAWPPAGHDSNLFPLSQPTTTPQPAVLLCSPCNVTPCDAHMWRPMWSGSCGPPCLLKPSLCPDNTSGCIPICNVPAYAHFLEAENCVWACDLGYFLAPAANECRPCAPSSCALGEIYVSQACYAEGASTDTVCLPCPSHLPSAALVLPLAMPGQCPYACDEGYYQFAFPAGCVPCSSATAAAAGYCAAGSKMRLCTTCTACPPMTVDNAIAVPTNDSVCRVRCSAGYHTVLRATEQVLPFRVDEAYDPDLIQCDECGLRTLPCPLTTCPAGQSLVETTSASYRCLACMTSHQMGCEPGTYAGACPGGVVTQDHCLLCPPIPTDGRFFVTTGACATGCAANTILHNNGTCLPCSTLYPVVPMGAPYQAFFALWNAVPARRWWPSIYDPPHLGVRPTDAQGNPRIESRAGRCWPCPTAAATEDNADGELCASSSLSGSSSQGYHASVSLAQQGGYILVIAPHRRLLATSSACEPGTYPSHTWCALCPPNHWCAQGLVHSCPAFSTAPPGSSSLAQCRCKTAFVKAGDNCEREIRELPAIVLTSLVCPPDAVQIRQASGFPLCTPCPPSTRPTRLPMTPNAADDTICVLANASIFQLPTTGGCGPGTQPNADEGCVPCPRDTFSPHLGHSPCIACPKDTLTATTGATHLADCLPASLF